MSFTILALDNVHQRAVNLLEAVEGFNVIAGKLSREEVMALIPTADAIIIRSATTADAELLQAAPRLKAIARAGVGVDNVDLAVATQQGVIVMNTPAGNTISTAEHTFGLMLSLARHIPQGFSSMEQGRWDRKLFMGVELRDKTLGLVGFGRIGRAVAKRALAFDMTVLAYDPFIPAEAMQAEGVTSVQLDELYAQADFISLHTPLMDSTYEMINAESLAKMKTGVRIVNAARGALIKDHDLAAAIKSGHVAGAALDVYHQEPPPADHPLIGLQGIIHTPHLAANTTDAQIQVGIDAAEQIIDLLINNQPHNVVNPDVLDQPVKP